MAGARQGPHRDHVVSAFYLRGFADAQGQLLCAPRDGSPEFRLAVGNATVHTDFYTFTGMDGAPSSEFEDWMAQIEQDAAPVLQSLVSGNRPPPVGDERMALAGWIALQWLRTESQRVMMGQLSAVVEAITSQHPSEFRPVCVEEVLRRVQTPRAIAAEPHLDQIRALLPMFAAVIMASPWVVSQFHKDHLITGDHPVHLIPDPVVGSTRPLAFGTARAVALPLTRHASLMAVTSRPMTPPNDPPPVEGTVGEARFMNLHTILNARRMVLRHPDDELPVPLAGFPPSQTGEVAFKVVSSPEER